LRGVFVFVCLFHQSLFTPRASVGSTVKILFWKITCCERTNASISVF
jgi:hypothetical protein